MNTICLAGKEKLPQLIVFSVQKNRSFALWKRGDFHMIFTFVAAPKFSRNCTNIMSSISDSSEEKNVSPDRIADGNYDASKLSQLKGLEAVRKKPGMYIGGTDERALHHCVSEVLDNSVDEHLAGHCDKIEVTIHVDGSISIRDDGRGIPVDINKDSGLPGVELVLTTLHSGGKYGQGGYKFSGGTHGVGAKCVNAVSEWLSLIHISRE